MSLGDENVSWVSEDQTLFPWFALLSLGSENVSRESEDQLSFPWFDGPMPCGGENVSLDSGTHELLLTWFVPMSLGGEKLLDPSTGIEAKGTDGSTAADWGGGYGYCVGGSDPMTDIGDVTSGGGGTGGVGGTIGLYGSATCALFTFISDGL